jgi:accessory colonization factor AcfC
MSIKTLKFMKEEIKNDLKILMGQDKEAADIILKKYGYQFSATNLLSLILVLTKELVND